MLAATYGQPSAKLEESDLHFQTAFGGGKLPAVEKGSTKCARGGAVNSLHFGKTDVGAKPGEERKGRERERNYTLAEEEHILYSATPKEKKFSPAGRGSPPPRPPGRWRRFSCSGEGDSRPPRKRRLRPRLVRAPGEESGICAPRAEARSLPAGLPVAGLALENRSEETDDEKKRGSAEFVVGRPSRTVASWVAVSFLNVGIGTGVSGVR